MKENKDYTKEIEFIQNWCITLMDYVATKDPRLIDFAKSSKESFKNNPIINTKKMLLAYQQGLRDMNEMAKSLKSSEYQELNKILFEKYGKTLMDFDSKKDKKIESIIKKGKISSDEEYELIENKVSELSQEKDKVREIEMLNKLLIDYYKK